jgi:hypothetical protein
MNSKNLAVAVVAVAMSLCTGAAAEKTPKVPKVKPVAAQAEHPTNAAVRSEDRADVQRSQQLLLEEKALEKQADEKNQQAKALIQQKNALHGQEISQEHQERADRNKNDRRVLSGDVRHESAESARLDQQIKQLEQERAAIMRQVREKIAERKAVEAQLRANEGHSVRK